MHDSRDEVLLFLAPVRKIMVIFTILVRKKYNWICSDALHPIFLNEKSIMQ